MNEILEILKYILPSIVVFFTASYLLKQFLENEGKRRMLELKHHQNNNNSNNFITPIRLQAYERIVLFLERISPSSLLLRVSEPNMNVIQLQTQLIKAIREEYEHNLSQQIYISPKSWELVKNAKDEMIKLISTAAGTVDKNAAGTELAKTIFELTTNAEKLPVDFAIEYVKIEIQSNFNGNQ